MSAAPSVCLLTTASVSSTYEYMLDALGPSEVRWLEMVVSRYKRGFTL
jgi:hypothetical protein